MNKFIKNFLILGIFASSGLAGCSSTPSDFTKHSDEIKNISEHVDKMKRSAILRLSQERKVIAHYIDFLPSWVYAPPLSNADAIFTSSVVWGGAKEMKHNLIKRDEGKISKTISNETAMLKLPYFLRDKRVSKQEFLDNAKKTLKLKDFYLYDVNFKGGVAPLNVEIVDEVFFADRGLIIRATLFRMSGFTKEPRGLEFWKEKDVLSLADMEFMSKKSTKYIDYPEPFKFSDELFFDIKRAY